MELSHEEFVVYSKREISKAVRDVPKYSRNSAAAKVASGMLERVMELNRMEIPDCSKGCAFCCYIQTDIHAGEAFVLAEAVRRMPDDQRQDVMTRLRSNADTFSRMSLTERQHAKIPCALLDLKTNSCSVYADRPVHCRKWHSSDVRCCEIEFHEPGTVGTPVDAVSMRLGWSVILGYWEASKGPSGELHQGVLMAIDPDAEKRFCRGEPVFDGWLASDANATEEELSEVKRESAALNDLATGLMSSRKPL
jgi:Fe-S-cluster containining protein